MDVELTVSSDESDDEAAELASLQQWLGSEPEFRGLVQPLTAPPGPGQMGAGMDAVLVALGPESAVGILVASLVSWLTHRRSQAPEATATITLRVRRPDGGELELSSTQVQGLTQDERQAQIDQLAKILLAGPDQP